MSAIRRRSGATDTALIGGGRLCGTVTGTPTAGGTCAPSALGVGAVTVCSTLSTTIMTSRRLGRSIQTGRLNTLPTTAVGT